MNYRTHTSYSKSVTLANGTELDLTLPIQPSGAMEYKDYLIREEPGKLILGYLADDSDCENPLENCDAMGHIYSASRDASREDHEKMQEALGLDRDWSPEVDLVSDEDVYKRCVEILTRSYNKEPGVDPEMYQDAFQHCLEGWEHKTGDGSDLDWVLDCLDDLDNMEPVLDIDKLRTNMWAEYRANGTIGNKYVVSLDVYQHGNVSYNVSGRGMQCYFDTARGGAVWVPDKCLKGGLDKLPPEAQMDQARVYAQQACEEYTAWCNGDCYGIIAVTYDPATGDEIDNDSCWGYIGGDYAYGALKQEHF